MDASHYEPLRSETVTQAEADQMLRMVLAGHPEIEQRRPLHEVAAALGLSDEQAHMILQEVRVKSVAEQEDLRVEKGLKREKRVIRMTLLASVFVLAIAGFSAVLGSQLSSSHHVGHGAVVISSSEESQPVVITSSDNGRVYTRASSDGSSSIVQIGPDSPEAPPTSGYSVTPQEAPSVTQ